MSDCLSVLPDELVADNILSRLPIKSIIQCRCVCKSWYSFITSCYFIKTHLLRNKTLTPQNPQFFLNRRDIFEETVSCLLLFDKQDYFNSMLFNLPLHYRPGGTKIIGSINGLICFSIGQGGVNFVVNFLVFNPSIGHFQSIPSPCPPPLGHLDNVVKGFGFDEKTQDYIILFISGQHGFIYSLNSNRWRSIRGPLPNDGNWLMMWDSVVYVNGKFHWLVQAPRRGRDKLFNFIMVFDVKCEAFGRISLPRCLAKPQHILFSNFNEYGESSIAVSREPEGNEWYVTHVWIMKEYGSAESWIKLTVGNPQRSREEFLKHQDHFLGFRNKDEVLFIRRANGSIAWQKINKNKKRRLELEEEVNEMMDVDNYGPWMHFSVHKYLPSLVLLDKENNVDVAAPTHTKRMKIV